MNKPAYDSNHFPHWTTVQTRFRDLDPLNHVNNAIFNTYFEEARIDFISGVPALAEQLQKGFSFVLANIQIDYVRPVTYPEVLHIGTGVKSLGNSSITSFQAIYNDRKELVSAAQASGVWFDLNKQRPARIPEMKYIDKLIVDF
jgi:acyl-CoA thioester hydrolase